MLDAQGEKWACEACIRGHRVSNCNHQERQLHHINRKGRPVSQCQHCRNLRKSRSAHVKCDCGERPHPKDKCCHLRKAGVLGEVNEDFNFNTAPDRPIALETVCCCSHGEKCSCALKRETFESEAAPLRPAPGMAAKPKPRLITAQSESALPTFGNGRHRPVQRLNNMAHTSGTPYPVPRSQTSHGLPTQPTPPSDGLAMDKPAASNRYSLQLQKSTQNPRITLRQIKSERTSPHLAPSPVPSLPVPHLTPLDFSLPASAYTPSSNQAPFALDDMSTINWDAYFASPSEGSSPVFSAGVNPPAVPWSAYDLPLGTNGLVNNISQPPSFASAENSVLTQAAMTSSSSGAVSELGDVGQLGDIGTLNQHNTPGAQQTPWDLFDGQESELYRLSSQSSCYGLPQQAMLASDSLGSISVDEFMKQAAPVSGMPYAQTATSQSFTGAHFYTPPDCSRSAPAIPTDVTYRDQSSMWPLSPNLNSETQQPLSYTTPTDSMYAWNDISSHVNSYTPNGLPPAGAGYAQNNVLSQPPCYNQSNPQQQSSGYRTPNPSGYSPGTGPAQFASYNVGHVTQGLPPTPQSEPVNGWPLSA